MNSARDIVQVADLCCVFFFFFFFFCVRDEQRGQAGAVPFRAGTALRGALIRGATGYLLSDAPTQALDINVAEPDAGAAEWRQYSIILRQC